MRLIPLISCLIFSSMSIYGEKSAELVVSFRGHVWDNLAMSIPVTVKCGGKVFKASTGNDGYAYFSVPPGSCFVESGPSIDTPTKSGKIYLSPSQKIEVHFELYMPDFVYLTPELRTQSEVIHSTDSVAPLFVRYLSKSRTDEQVTHKGPGLEVGLGSAVFKGGILTCSISKLDCVIIGQTRFQGDNREVSAQRVLIKATGRKDGIVVATHLAGRWERSFLDLAAVPAKGGRK